MIVPKSPENKLFLLKSIFGLVIFESLSTRIPPFVILPTINIILQIFLPIKLRLNERLLNIVALETTIKNVEDLGISRTPAFRMAESSKTLLKHLAKQLSPEQLLLEMMRLSQV